MTPSAAVSDRIRKANALLAKAARYLDAGGSARLADCKSTLEQSLAELCAAEEAALADRKSAAACRDEILRMKARAGGMERVSHVANAFLSGDPGITGNSPLYGLDGRAETDSRMPADTAIQA
jgi:hypothetical protein